MNQPSLQEPCAGAPRSPDGETEVQRLLSVLAAKVAAAVVGFFAGFACFGTAWFATSRDVFLPFGITWFGLVVLLLCSLLVGALARRRWRSTLLVQILATLPYVGILLLGVSESFNSLLYPGILWSTSALGIYMGHSMHAWTWADAA
jgi:hypothetical protein